MIEGKAADVEGNWNDISNEAFREYVFSRVDADGKPYEAVVRVENPVKVRIKRKGDGDSHRVVCVKDGVPTSVYIPSGWIAIRWTGIDGTEAMSW